MLNVDACRRYCARLPCDALTTLVPSCEIKKLEHEQYQCILTLPVNSPARTTITVRSTRAFAWGNKRHSPFSPFQGPARPTIKQAKLSCAKRLCEHLLKAGLLVEHERLASDAHSSLQVNSTSSCYQKRANSSICAIRSSTRKILLNGARTLNRTRNQARFNANNCTTKR